jgi:ribosomal protein S27AE
VNAGAPYRVDESYGLEKCPHCGGLTAIAPNRHLRWVCGACGGPIIPGMDATKLDDEAKRMLARARGATSSARRIPILEIVAPLVFAGSCAMGFVLGQAMLLFLAVVVLVLVFGGYATRREKGRASAKLFVEDAWLHAAGLLAEERGGYLSAQEVAARLRLPLPDAERLLTRLSVVRGRVDVGEDAQVRYRVDASEPLPAADLLSPEAGAASERAGQTSE